MTTPGLVNQTSGTATAEDFARFDKVWKLATGNVLSKTLQVFVVVCVVGSLTMISEFFHMPSVTIILGLLLLIICVVWIATYLTQATRTLNCIKALANDRTYLPRLNAAISDNMVVIYLGRCLDLFTSIAAWDDETYQFMCGMLYMLYVRYTAGLPGGLNEAHRKTLDTIVQLQPLPINDSERRPAFYRRQKGIWMSYAHPPSRGGEDSL